MIPTDRIKTKWKPFSNTFFYEEDFFINCFIFNCFLYDTNSQSLDETL